MLMPALSKAKQSGYRAVDLNNLKQLNLAVQIVAEDNQDVMAWPNWLSGDSATRQGWLYTLDSTATGPAQFKVQTGSFWAVLGSQKIYFCPSDDTNSPMFQLRGQQISSYVMNGAVCDYSNSPPVKLSRLSPSGVSFWECANNDVYDNTHLFNDGSSSPDENTSVRHGEVAIYGAFDGSARTMLLTLWENKMQAADANELWCYPNSPDGR